MATLSCKLLVVGAPAAGKTSLVHRFTEQTFEEVYVATLGTDFVSKTVSLSETKDTVNLKMWDLGGDKRFASMTPLYCRGASGAIVVFDVTDLQSIKSAKNWYSSVRKDLKAAGGTSYVLFLANKCDRPGRADFSSITDECVEDVCGMQEVSAKTGKGVNAAITGFLDFIWKREGGRLESAGNPGAIRLASSGDNSGEDHGEHKKNTRAASSCCQ